MKLYLAFTCTILVIVILLCLQLVCEYYLQLNDDLIWVKRHVNPVIEYNELSKDVNHPVIVWWTNFIDLSITKSCGNVSCFFTNNRLFRNHSLAKALMFYGSNINLTDMPLPRDGHKMVWALLHEESPRNIPALSHMEALSLFNYTSTFSRYSDFPLTTQHLKDLDSITGEEFFLTVEKKRQLKKDLGLAPLVYIQSDCSTPIDRDSYVAELSKYIKIDSYGACLHNKDLPPSLLDNLSTMMSDELLHFVAQYEFAIAIENGECEDYITEKLWRPLIAGSVPIYIGSPSVKDWLPNNNSAILGLDFPSPKVLAEYLLELINDHEKYNLHLQHKLQPEKQSRVTNRRLIEAMNNRKWGIENDFHEGSFIEHFECFVCRKIHESNDVLHFANEMHYKCPMPRSPLTRQQNLSNMWLDQWKTGKCEAIILSHFVYTNGDNYSNNSFFNELGRRFRERLC